MEHISSKKIVQLRESHHLTQLQLAKFLEVSPSTVYKWEKGSTSPHSDFLPSMARLFEVSIDELYKIDERKELLSLIHHFTFNLEPIDAFSTILHKAECYLAKTGKDAELEYRLLCMKNAHLVKKAEILARETEAFSQKHGHSYPQFDQEISIMRENLQQFKP